jgi:hypothetical protein
MQPSATPDSFEQCVKRAVEQGGRDERSGVTVVVQKQPDLSGIVLDFAAVSLDPSPTPEE